MSSDLEALYKILKNEENRRLLLLLNEKEALSYDELLDSHAGVHMLNHRLSVLGDFLEKMPDGKYVLSEKGKIAYKLLNELPENTGATRRWKITWLISTVSCIAAAFFLWHSSNRPLTSLIHLLFIGLFGSICGYALKVKPKVTGRFFYIAFGAVFLGCFFLLLSMKLFLNDAYFARFPPGSTGGNLRRIIVIAVCYGIGGIVGELIGKKMQYRWPPFLR